MVLAHFIGAASTRLGKTSLLKTGWSNSPIKAHPLAAQAAPNELMASVQYGDSAHSRRISSAHRTSVSKDPEDRLVDPKIVYRDALAIHRRTDF